MILLFYLTVASAMHTRIWHGDSTLKAFEQPETVEIMHRIENKNWIRESAFRRYFDFVCKSDDKQHVLISDIETSFKGWG